MKVFLSYAVGQVDAPVAARLRAVAAAYDIQILLPDRTNILNYVTTDTCKKIKQSDALIALRTITAHEVVVNLVNLELQTALQSGKPVIALIEQGVQVQGVLGDQIVYFNRFNPTAHEASLMNVLEKIRQQQQPKNDLSALGWIAGIALGLVALNAIVNDEK